MISNDAYDRGFFIMLTMKIMKVVAHLKYWSSVFFVFLFFCFWLCWVFIVVCRLSLVVASRGYSSLRCTAFSLRWLLVAEHGL